MTNPIDLGFARSAHRMVKQADEALNLMVRSEDQRLSLLEGLTDLRSGHGLQGFNREALQEIANVQGTDFDPQNPTWPYSILSTRATPLTVASAANGGDLVYSENQQLIDIFRPYSPLLKSGVTVISNLEANAVFPRVTQDVTGAWLSSETATATDAPPAFSSYATAPHTFAITLRWSRQLQLQAKSLEDYIKRIAARGGIEAVDLAAITGAGSAGVPLGLLNQTGIGAQSGTALSHAGTWTARATLADLNVDDEAIAWLGNPDVRTLLATRERAPGDKFIWDQDVVTDRAARVSTIVPSGTLIAGDWSQLVYCFYGPGFQIDVTPFASAADFQLGNMALRLMVSCDVVLLHPAAFVAITSVS